MNLVIINFFTTPNSVCLRVCNGGHTKIGNTRENKYFSFTTIKFSLQYPLVT